MLQNESPAQSLSSLQKFSPPMMISSFFLGSAPKESVGTNKIEEATAKITQLIMRHDVDVISIGNGTATKKVKFLLPT